MSAPTWDLLRVNDGLANKSNNHRRPYLRPRI